VKLITAYHLSVLVTQLSWLMFVPSTVLVRQNAVPFTLTRRLTAFGRLLAGTQSFTISALVSGSSLTANSGAKAPRRGYLNENLSVLFWYSCQPVVSKVLEAVMVEETSVLGVPGVDGVEGVDGVGVVVVVGVGDGVVPVFDAGVSELAQPAPKSATAAINDIANETRERVFI